MKTSKRRNVEKSKQEKRKDPRSPLKADRGPFVIFVLPRPRSGADDRGVTIHQLESPSRLVELRVGEDAAAADAES